MHKLTVFLNAKFLELVFDEVLNCLNIVVGNLLNILNLLRILCGEISVDVSQSLKVCLVKALELLQRKLTKGYEILNFNPDPVFYKSVLRKVQTQIFNLFAVSAVNWRHCH